MQEYDYIRYVHLQVMYMAQLISRKHYQENLTQQTETTLDYKFLFHKLL